MMGSVYDGRRPASTAGEEAEALARQTYLIKV
jgi:hypothetical protein